MKTPNDLLNFIVNEIGIPMGNICSLHTSCISPDDCTSRTNHKYLVDFDKVKTWYCSNNKQASCKSVDGLGCKDNILCLVEIKGWKKFFHYRPSANEKQIKEQVGAYDFAGKLHDSIDICNNIAHDADFAVNNRLAYIIVTDISVKINPLAMLQFNLNSLADTASSMENICNKYMTPKIKGISGVNTYYKQCTEFDSFWSTL